MLHDWEKISYEESRDFLEFLFSLDIEIVGHNLKYDLEIVQRHFDKNQDNIWIWKEYNVWQLQIFW